MLLDVKQLKTATLDLHRAAERHVRILDDDATIGTYVRFLDRMHGVHAAAEAMFAEHAPLKRAGFDAQVAADSRGSCTARRGAE